MKCGTGVGQIFSVVPQEKPLGRKGFWGVVGLWDMWDHIHTLIYTGGIN